LESVVDRRRARLSALAAVGLVTCAAWMASGLGVRPQAREIRSLPGFAGTRVHDDAAVLGSFGALLEGSSAQWEDELGIEVQVVTLRAGAMSLDALSDRVFDQRRVGRRTPTGGLVLVLDAEGRRAHIGLSYGLRGAFPAELLERVEARLAPHAPYASVGMATLDALHDLKDQAFARAAAGELPLPIEVRRRDAFQRGMESLAAAAETPDELARLGESGDFKQSVPEPERALYAPARDPLESAERFLRVLGDLAGDPTLPLFTPGSQVQLERYPVAPVEYRKRYEATVASRPLRVLTERDRAVVLSDEPARGFVPILLQQSEGVWRVDLVETWKNLFFTDGGRYVVVNRNNPYAFGLSELPGQGWHVLDPIDLGGSSPQQAIAELEAQLARRDDPAAHFRLAEILFRNCFAAVDALSHYEAAARGASHVHTYVWTMAERASYLGLYQQAIPFYEVLGTGAFERLGDAYYALGDYRSAAGYYEGALDHGGDPDHIASRIERARGRRREG
jgi:tetratricopeptide (TPR) repeat protein